MPDVSVDHGLTHLWVRAATQTTRGGEKDGTSLTRRLSGRDPTKYRGVIYYLADRSQFTSDLPQLAVDRVAQHVLVEAKTGGTIDWPAKSLPVLNWAVDASEGVLVDGVDETMPETDLMTDHFFAPESGSDGSVFQNGLQAANPTLDTDEALITTIGYSIGIRVASNGKSLADSGNTVLRGLANSRNVPRRISP